ncbi:MAG: molybdopterin-dependent oxidoreductase, partial [Thermomicrobiales bacterium]|nr:molybdopterin-dependent oxidoreductase [Thermomicrobiales bacterium]
MNGIGASPERVDAVAKVTGRAAYLANARFEGVVHAGIVRSTRPHAVIRRIATDAARQAPGVLAVVTGEDLTRLMPEPYWGPAVLDQSALAIGRVRHIGEPVAAVVAATPEQAEAAAALVDVDYDDLPAVFDPKQALAPGAPLIHEQVRPARAFEDLSELRPAGGTNVNIHYRLRRGDVDQALATADVVVEDTYAYSRNQFCALEPHLAIAQVDAAGAI